MNIAFIHNTFPAGGAERVTIDIAKYLNENSKGNYKTFVLATSLNENLVDDEIKNLIKIIVIPKDYKLRSKAIEEAVKNNDIDIMVQAVHFIYDINGIKERTGSKLVFANHGEPFWQRYPIIRRRQNLAIKRLLWKLFLKKIYVDKGKALKLAIERSRVEYDKCDAYTVLCEAYKQTTIKAFGLNPNENKIVAIENSERLRENVNYEKENTIIFCGRLDNLYKRVDRLLRIWAQAQSQLPSWKLLIVGDGPQRKMLECQSKDLKLERISFEGEQKDVKKYYDKASILCLVSQSEGWPLVLTEAQACGVISIAFDCCGGVNEILSPNGVNGFLVNAFDEDDFAKTLVRVASMNESEKIKIRNEAIAHRAKYTPEIISQKWKDLFDSLMNS